MISATDRKIRHIRAATQAATPFNAATSPLGSVPPACAMSCRPPPFPPTCCATKLTSSPAFIFDVVSAVTRFLRRAYPERVNADNQTSVTMMLMGMINWTFTWLRPGGPMTYSAFAEEVIRMLEHGLAQ